MNSCHVGQKKKRLVAGGKVKKKRKSRWRRRRRRRRRRRKKIETRDSRNILTGEAGGGSVAYVNSQWHRVTSAMLYYSSTTPGRRHYGVILRVPSEPLSLPVPNRIQHLCARGL
jgi:hypothetical protein